MSAYSYRAARQDGAIVTGAVEAESHGQASATLASRGLFAIAVAPAVEGHRPAASRRDLAIVFRGIAALEPLASGSLRQTLTTARERLREGASFAHALATGRGVIPGLVIGMIRAGERGSQLEIGRAS